MDVMGDNRTYSPTYGVSGGAATHYVITTDGNVASAGSANLPGYPIAFDLVVSLNGSGVAAWGFPGWSLVPFDGFSTPTNTPTVTETGRDASSITLHVSATNFADLYAWAIAFDGTQTVDALTPSFIGEITGFIFVFPVPSGTDIVDQATNNPTPFLFDPSGPPSMTVVPLAGAQFLPAGEASFASVGITATVQDGGTGAINPFIAAVSSDPSDGWAVSFDGGSNYAGYEYQFQFSMNGAINVFGTLSLKDLNLP